MKVDRHSKIVELIGKYQIETQEELAEYLKRDGYKVTQATVSRDIRELKLTKVQGENGRQRYAVMQPQRDFSEKYLRIFRDCYVSMDMAQNLLIIKTVSGMAMAVAEALDVIGFHELVGCVAGDNTIFCAVRTVDDTIILMDKLKKLLLQRSEFLIDNKSTILQLLKQIQLNKILQPKESNQINESDFGVISGLSDKSNGSGIGFNAKIR